MEALLFVATMVALGIVMRWSLREDPGRKRKPPKAPADGDPGARG